MDFRTADAVRIKINLLWRIKMNVLHNFMETFLPYAISAFEIIGIFVVCFSGLHAFWQYCQNTFMKRRFDLQANFAKGLAVGLEFKMAAEILKTVLVREWEELLVLGAVIILRALLSFLIHFEMKENHAKTSQN